MKTYSLIATIFICAQVSPTALCDTAKIKTIDAIINNQSVRKLLAPIPDIASLTIQRKINPLMPGVGSVFSIEIHSFEQQSMLDNVCFAEVSFGLDNVHVKHVSGLECSDSAK